MCLFYIGYKKINYIKLAIKQYAQDYLQQGKSKKNYATIKTTATLNVVQYNIV